jgi:hypothetical protein
MHAPAAAGRASAAATEGAAASSNDPDRLDAGRYHEPLLAARVKKAVMMRKDLTGVGGREQQRAVVRMTSAASEHHGNCANA